MFEVDVKKHDGEGEEGRGGGGGGGGDQLGFGVLIQYITAQYSTVQYGEL